MFHTSFVVRRDCTAVCTDASDLQSTQQQQQQQQPTTLPLFVANGGEQTRLQCRYSLTVFRNPSLMAITHCSILLTIFLKVLRCSLTELLQRPSVVCAAKTNWMVT